MTWEQLSINKPHLVYIILGGFTSLFMLCSSVIKERLYIGEATVATLCGIIFGPHAANLINPDSWGNVDQITEEFSRIVLVVQCFAVGVELPKAYMERHWRSVTFLLVPVMTFGWLITSLFIWGLFTPHLNWIDSLAIAACVTATDPVLASSVVGKGKFAKRVPKHLRDLLSAESGCNDGMAFPFIYLALYILRYAPNADKVAFHWFCLTILYECIFGAVYGFLVGYAARRMIRYAHEHNLIDRESFLVFYFVLALFCAGSGSILGIDDLLVGFACGVGFSNDGWFTEETEETHVSNVIDLLINLTFFVYFGTIIPWQQYNSGVMGLDVWRLVVIGILVLLFRRIPIMMALKPLIPDVKTWREALFAGHFGPIGVGAIFVAILARAELETESTTPLKEIPPEGTVAHSNVIYLVWPIVTFLVICSILVHGSSIAVFTLGKRINTLSLTLSYTQGNDQGANWMDRLPRIQSRSKSSMSMQRSDSEIDEKQAPAPGMLAVPGTFLRRQKEEDNPSRTQSRASSRHRSRRSRNWDSGRGPGGPISQSAIAPARKREESPQRPERSDSDTIAVKNEDSSNEKISERDSDRDRDADDENADEGEIYEEGAHTIYEDSEGNVLAVERKPGQSTGDAREDFERREGRRLMRKLHHYEHAEAARSGKEDKVETAQHVEDDVEAEKHDRSERQDHAKEADEAKDTEAQPQENETKQPKQWRGGLNKMGAAAGLRRRNTGDVEKIKPAKKTEKPKETRGPAHAYQYGNTIIVEDQDGEVIKKYDIPGPSRKQMSASDHEKSHNRIANMSRMLIPRSRHDKPSPGDADDGSAAVTSAADGKKRVNNGESDGKSDDDDQRVRFTLAQGGRRLSKAEFIDQIRTMDPRSRAEAVENSDVPEPVKREARRDLRDHAKTMLSRGASSREVPVIPEDAAVDAQQQQQRPRKGSAALQPTGGEDPDELELVDSDDEIIPFHNVSAELRKLQGRSAEGGETAAERRRRQALEQPHGEDDSDDDGTERVPPQPRREASFSPSEAKANSGDLGETQAERRRREGALGIHHEDDESDSEDDNQPRQIPPRQSIRFADDEQHAAAAAATASSDNGQAARHSALRWGKNIVGR